MTNLNAAPQSDWLDGTRKRIEEQQAIVDNLKPGGSAHHMAVQLLLMYQDSLHVLTEASELMVELKRKRRDSSA